MPSSPNPNEINRELKIGQLLFSRDNVPDIENNIRQGKISGIYCGPHTSADRVAELRNLAPIPLFVAMDLEIGNFNGSSEWPMAMAVAATGSIELAYKWAKAQADEARAVGVNCVFGPVLDVAINPEGECVGTRSLGSDPAKVAELAAAVVRGYQDGGLQTYAKHFPGFGRCREDAHIELCNLNADAESIQRDEMAPYRAAAKAGLKGIMTGHIMTPAIDKDAPCPISAKFAEIARGTGFDGLMITDSLAMKAMKYLYTPEELYVKSILSGHHLLLADYETPDAQGYEFIARAVADGVIAESLIDAAVEKIMAAKSWLNKFKTTPPDYAANRSLFKEISEKSMTASTRDGGGFASLSTGEKQLIILQTEYGRANTREFSPIGNDAEKLKQTIRAKFPRSEVIEIPEYPDFNTIAGILTKGLEYDEINLILRSTGVCYKGSNHFSRPVQALTRGVAAKTNTIVINGNPYAAKDIITPPQLLFTYSKGAWIESMIKVLTGKLEPTGKLPVETVIPSNENSA